MKRIALLSIVTTMFLTGCSSYHTLTASGEQVKLFETLPSNDCQLLGDVTGSQSNWLSGYTSDSSGMRSAANDLRNKAAAMGGNAILGLTTPTDTLLSSFIPVDSKVTAKVYKCP